MPIFMLEVETDGHEIYHVEAETEDAARELFEEGNVGHPDMSEVTGASIERIEEVTE